MAKVKQEKKQEPSPAVIILVAVILVAVIITAFVLLSRNPAPTRDYQIPNLKIPEDGPARHLLPSQPEFPEEWVQGFTLDTDKQVRVNALGFTAGHAILFTRKATAENVAVTTVHGSDIAVFANEEDATAFHAELQAEMKGKSFSNGKLQYCFITFGESKSSVKGFMVCRQYTAVFEVFIIEPKIGELRIQQMLELLAKTALSIAETIERQS